MMQEAAKIRLGEYIRRRRSALSPPLTIDQLAKAVSMGGRRVGDIERGRWDTVRPATRDAFERALGWELGSWDQILGGGEPTIATRQAARRSDEPDDLIYVMRKVGSAPERTLRIIREILETTEPPSH